MFGRGWKRELERELGHPTLAFIPGTRSQSFVDSMATLPLDLMAGFGQTIAA
jgi:hypothetical protein